VIVQVRIAARAGACAISGEDRFRARVEGHGVALVFAPRTQASF
jgi:hypothetical protein